MGRAEDVFKARREVAKNAAQKRYEEECRSTREAIEPLIPKIVANLEKLNYPEGKYPFYWVDRLEINGEERIGWRVVEGNYEYPHRSYIHILADGSLVIDRERVVEDPGHLSGRQREQIIERLRDMANYQP
jgi:hypothetical protein